MLENFTELNESNFNEHTSQGLVLVDFHAPWCGPCRLMGQKLCELTGIPILKVNVDDCPNLASACGVEAIPHIMIMKDGETKEKFVGVTDINKIQAKVNALKG